MLLIEELDIKKHVPAPGYAYVPDTGPKLPNALVPAGRNRAARNHPTASAYESTAKQDAKITRRLAELDKDNSRDVTIPVPIRHRDNAGRASHGKVSANVRKILASMKTFANYLSDAEAEAALRASQPQSSSASSAPTHSAPPPPPPPPRAPPVQAPLYGPNLTSKGTRSHKKKVPLNAPSVSTPLKQVSTASSTPSIPNPKREDEDGDIPMLDSANDTTSGPDDSLAPSHLDCTPIQPEIPSNPRDNDPLLVSRIPPLPSQEELDALLAAPPLTYNEARAKVSVDAEGRPIGPKPRLFCEICGYWGRARCFKCGGRVCGVECLGVHEEYSCVKFYA